MKKTMKQGALDHYDRMIAFAKYQDKDDYVSSTLMIKEIGEYWGSEDCHYCSKYNIECSLCELRGGTIDPEDCCAGRHGKMAMAETWGEWIKAAKKVRAYIEKHG